jgi:hypothetical protein
VLFEARRAGADFGYVLAPEATALTEPPAGPAGFYHQRARWASKGFRFPKDAMVFSAVVWLLNVFLTAGGIAAVLGATGLLPWIGAALGVKAVGDLALLTEGRVLGLRGAVVDYLTGLPLHIPYVAVAGLAGTLQLFRWK